MFSRSVERLLTRLGHRFPSARLVTSPCFRYGTMLAGRGGNLDRWAKLRDGSDLHLSLDEAVFRHLYFFGHYEERVTDLMLRTVRPGQLWLDIGANIGVFTVLLGKGVGPGGGVHAFEPNPAMAHHLGLSLQRNALDHVVLHPCALGATRGRAPLYLPRTADEADGGSGRGSLLAQQDIHDGVSISVPVSTLDEELDAETRPIFGMKIDVEGYESAVLDGAPRLLGDRPPRIIFSEVTHRPQALLHPAQLVAKFISLGYLPFRTEPFQPYHPGQSLDRFRDANMVFIHADASDLAKTIAD